MTAWDPIGVGDAPEAWSEYEAYAPQLARILRETEDSQDATARAAEYLTGIEGDEMELHADQGRLANVRLAASLVAWYEWSRARV